jgi:hypothetical protein
MRVEIDTLVERARQIEAGRRVCARRLAVFNRATFAAARTDWTETEEREIDRLTAAHATAMCTLDRIASSLRAASLCEDDNGDFRAMERGVLEASSRLMEELALRSTRSLRQSALITALAEGSRRSRQAGCGSDGRTR